MAEETGKRKGDHIKISLSQNVQARKVTTGFEDVYFVHKSLPEVDRQEVCSSTTVLGHRFAAPLIVGAITGGTEQATKINATIAEAVEELGLGMGVGSQRAAIEDRKLEKTFTVVRKKAPTAFLIANIGGIQLVNGYGPKELERAIKMIEADAIAIHLNSLQETIQPEGQTNFKGIIEKIEKVTMEIDKPVIIKETGAGMSSEVAAKLAKAGVKSMDVSGAGGTSFAAVEYYRARGSAKNFGRRLGDVLWDWGIPTAVSIVEVSQTVSIPIIASGGIRNGVEIAKAMTLGASLTSCSQPVLHAAVKGLEETKAVLSDLIGELENAMFLVGAKTTKGLWKTPVVIMGKTAEWLRARGFETDSYARRGKG